MDRVRGGDFQLLNESWAMGMGILWTTDKGLFWESIWEEEWMLRA
jgi:hypothetical protein